MCNVAGEQGHIRCAAVPSYRLISRLLNKSVSVSGLDFLEFAFYSAFIGALVVSGFAFLRR